MSAIKVVIDCGISVYVYAVIFNVICYFQSYLSISVTLMWRSGKALVLINEVNLHRAYLVLLWLTVSGFNSIPGAGHSCWYVISHPILLHFLDFEIGRQNKCVCGRVFRT